MVVSFRSVPYDTRLDELKMLSVEQRRMRGDLIHVFRIIKGKVDVDMGDFFKLKSDRVLRGNSLTLYKSGFLLT